MIKKYNRPHSYDGISEALYNFSPIEYSNKIDKINLSIIDLDKFKNKIHELPISQKIIFNCLFSKILAKYFSNLDYIMEKIREKYECVNHLKEKDSRRKYAEQKYVNVYEKKEEWKKLVRQKVRQIVINIINSKTFKETKTIEFYNGKEGFIDFVYQLEIDYPIYYLNIKEDGQYESYLHSHDSFIIYFIFKIKTNISSFTKTMQELKTLKSNYSPSYRAFFYQYVLVAPEITEKQKEMLANEKFGYLQI